jgi:hypothetical protein
MSFRVPTTRSRFSGEGAFDAAPTERGCRSTCRRSAQLLGGLFGAMAGPDAPDFEDPTWKIDVVQDGDVARAVPGDGGRAPDGKSWVRGDHDGPARRRRAGARAVHADGSAGDARLPPRRSGESRRSAPRSLGHETTHYRATIDPADYEKVAPVEQREQLGALVDEIVGNSGIGKIPVDVWLDASGMVRKVGMRFSATQPGSTQTAESSVSFELWDYGEPVTIEPPPASDVADASSLRD